MLATQMDKNASLGDRARDLQFGKSWGLDLGACISVRIFGGRPAGSAEQLRLCPKRMLSMSYSSLFPSSQSML